MLSQIFLSLILFAQALCYPISVLSTSHCDLGTINLEISFSQPILSRKSDGYHSVEISDLPLYSAPGKPVLPYKTVRVLIPQDKAVDRISVSKTSQVLGSGLLLEYGKTPVPVSTGEVAEDKPDPALYRSSSPFPATPCFLSSEQYLRGYKILLLTVFPVQYLPNTGELWYYKNLHLELMMKDASDDSIFLRGYQKDEALVKNVIANPQAVETYSTVGHSMHQKPLSEPLQSYDYVVVTNQNLSASFQPLIDWKNQKGLSATIVLVEDILENPEYFCDGALGDGCASHLNDTAAKIRNFIKDAYVNWGTDYVLLGGDTEIVPARKVYAYSEGYAASYFYTDYEIPCDMYYGALDGSWDNDNDTIFGEGVFDLGPENGTAGEEADFFAEVYIGRASVDNAQEAASFVNKTLWYEHTSDDEYLKRALMIGETLDEETEGGNSKDLVTYQIPQYTIEKLYDRDMTFGFDALVSELNSGPHLVNHAGHAYYDNIMRLSPEDVDNLTNTQFFMMYSIGCYSAAFDEVSDPKEAVAEHFIRKPTGAFAYIGNTRYGWYIPGTMKGPGDIFDKEFYRVLGQSGGNLGKILQTSKENLYSPHVHRWTYFNLVLLGDPETEIVTDIKAPTAHFNTTPNPSQLSSRVVKGIVELTGTAKRGTAPGATFSNFTIEFGYGRTPSSWQTTTIELVDNGQTETEYCLLGTWDTNLVTPTVCTLRLRVTDQSGAVGEDRWIVEVKAMPAIRVLPELINTYEGLTFTATVRITAPENLYGLDFHVKWNTTYLEYVSHALYIPANDYSWGVLYKPVQITKNEVDQVAGTYWVAAKSQSPAFAFTKDGTVFNMTFLAKTNGTCNLEIYASSLTSPSNQPIAHNRWNATVEIAPGTHDGAVTGILCVKAIVGQGRTTKIKVTITNEGTFAENFEVTAYANGVSIGTTQVSVNGQETGIATITWNTTGWTYGDYTISANVTLVEGETDKLDNAMTDSDICVTIAGDVDGNYKVDIFDIVKMARGYGSSEGQTNFDINCDINGNGAVDIFDVVIAACNYGRNWYNH